MISFGTKYWFILLVVILVIAAGVVTLLYFRNNANRELSKTQIRILMSLRFFSFFLIAFLLLSPFIRNLKKVVQNPIIITAWDNSSSLTSVGDSLQNAALFASVKEEINDQLGSDFEVIEYTFGETTKREGQQDFTDKESNYSEMISSVMDMHFNQNIGALIVAGDGIYNQGKNPVNLLNELSFPIYSIGFGDTSVVSDSRIQSIRVNRTAFSGNKFPVEIDMQFSKVKGKNLKLSIIQNGAELASQVITPPNDNYFHSQEFILEAGDPGLKHYSVVIEPVENERNTENNKAGFVINVLKNKQKILILSDGSHPDIGAIKNTLEEQKTYEVSVFTKEPYPSNLQEFNLVILNQLPTSGKSAASIIETARKSRLPLLFIVGNKTFLPQLNVLNQGVKIEALAGSGEEAQSNINPTYATFNLSEDFIEILPKFPPLQVPFANYEMEAEFTPLFYQKLKGIETGKPIIATGKLEGRKIAYIFGEGIWRWRLFDYYQNQSHARFNELINQLIQYLALRENEDNFIVEFKPVYTETEDIILNAELYNDAFERISSEEVNIELKNSNDEDFNFSFDIQGQNYFLNAGHLPMGDYTFSADVTIGTETFTESGNFTIVPVDIENVITRANHTMLYQLAKQSGGELYMPAQTTELISELKTVNKLKASTYFQEMINELLNLRWLFFVLLLLLSMEWFLRKYWGIY
ncbi:hypothetical protein [uncultured Draconibacterium sp.]|uniref:hypothetical protein n=1 Tax=uncultured Draconibacterium sp. TaxID=1573823 RepID=UPI0032163A7B